jgi:hypothetical protein
MASMFNGSLSLRFVAFTLLCKLTNGMLDGCQ